ADLAAAAPDAYRRAGLPPVTWLAAPGQRQAWLTSPAIRRAYLGGRPLTPASYAAAVLRYGEPLSPPVTRGPATAQAFAGVVLQVPAPGGPVHAAPVTQAALAAGVLRPPAQARAPRRPPPLPDPFALGPPRPTSAEPFVITLTVALAGYGVAVARLARKKGGTP